MANTVLPDIAVQLDIMLSSDTPDMQNEGDIGLGKGPCMSLYSFHGRGTLNGLIPHPSLVKLFEEISKKPDSLASHWGQVAEVMLCIFLWRILT